MSERVSEWCVQPYLIPSMREEEQISGRKKGDKAGTSEGGGGGGREGIERKMKKK